MSNDRNSGSRSLPKIWLHLGIGIGVGGAFALANIPNWHLVSGYLVFGLVFGLTSGIVQAQRSNR
jgi:hypothetical protein